IVNHVSPTLITLSLLYMGPITGTSQYLVAGSNDITFQGTLFPPVVTSSIAYGGLIHNDSYTNINVVNMHITAAFGVNPTLSPNSGWICHQNFGPNGLCSVTNCSSAMGITGNGGGIVGSNSSVNAVSCVSSGSINDGSGGIFGASCFNCTASYCSSSGSIDNGSGGIYGQTCNLSATLNSCTAIGCFSTGAIGSDGSYNSGGIFGMNCNESTTECTSSATNCFSTGLIYGDFIGSNGGIFGGNSLLCDAINCYSVGNIGTGCGGIYRGGTQGTATNCYSVGVIGGKAGGIFGEGSTFSTATSCYSTGSSIGSQGGGIFGHNTTNSSTYNSYSVGAVGVDAGGIVGANATGGVVDFCYMTGGNTGGGSYDPGTYEIYGSDTTECYISTCYSEDPTKGNIWNNYNASTALHNNYKQQVWLIAFVGTPYLLASFSSNLGSNPGTIVGNQAPIGYSYYYILSPLNITSNGAYTNSILSGYYLEQQQNPLVSAPYSSNIFGYNILSYNVGVNVKQIVVVDGNLRKL
ncbi:MAG: hypothetical protein Gaeavirus7_1, partial [Gaeavirus sp.]